MGFFDSDIVRSELAEISDLQERIYSNVFKFSSMSREEKLEHVDLLDRLLQTQQVLYTRLKLSDDPKAKEMKEHIINQAVSMGMSSSVDFNTLLDNMKSVLKDTKNQVDKS